MKNRKIDILYLGIYILLFAVLFNLTIDNPYLELFRRYYWIIIAGLSFIYPFFKPKKPNIKNIILSFLVLSAVTMIPEWIGDFIYYIFTSSAYETILFFEIFTALSMGSLITGYITGTLIALIFKYFITPNSNK